jgi:hypothetical protein
MPWRRTKGMGPFAREAAGADNLTRHDAGGNRKNVIAKTR